MKCNLCNKETIVTCICGFCNKCIDNYGHDGCHKKLELKGVILNEKSKEKILKGDKK